MMRNSLTFLLAISLVACAPLQLPTLESTPVVTPPLQVQPSTSPSASAQDKHNLPTPTALVEATKATSQVLYYEYEGFELEGVPPYPSPYVTMNKVDRNWVDMSDPLRFRNESYYTVSQPKPKEGFERIVIGTGAGGLLETCRFYEGNAICSQQPITRTLTYDEWLTTSQLGQRWLDNIETPDAIGGYIYKGIQTDETWGEVHVFEREGTLTSSDLYTDYPMVETLTFDTTYLRTIEWKRLVMDGETFITHALSRLVKWEMVSPSEIPPGLFATRLN